MVELVRAGRHGPRILRFRLRRDSSREILRADQRLTLAHSMPWFGHTVQNRDTAIDALEGNVAYQQR